VRTKEGWRAAGRKYGERWVIIIGKAAKIIAKAINAIYSKRGVEREVRYNKDKSYIKLTNVDLELLGMMQRKRWWSASSG